MTSKGTRLKFQEPLPSNEWPSEKKNDREKIKQNMPIPKLDSTGSEGNKREHTRTHSPSLNC